MMLIRCTQWIRATEATRSVIRRSEARVRGCHDEVVFTEELNWGDGVGRHEVLPCCHSECLLKQFSLTKRAPPPRKTKRASCAADDSPPLAPPPPNASRHGWANASRDGSVRR